MTEALYCPNCAAPLPASLWNAPDFASCPGCGRLARALVFPALVLPLPAGGAGEKIQEAGEAACFFHPEKRAAAPCDRCGRFLCSLCDLEMNGEHLCPSCFESGQRKGKIKNLENRCFRHDRLAFALAVWPVASVFFASFTILTAPAAVYTAIRHWNSPRGPRRSGRGYLIAALLAATIEILVWVFVIASIMKLQPGGRAHHGSF
jgi:hypothetical protein